MQFSERSWKIRALIKKGLLFAVFTILFLGIASSAFSQNKKAFQKLLKENELQFQMPEGYKEVKVRKNGDMGYHYAIYNPELEMEIRYSIFSIKEFVRQNPGFETPSPDHANPNEIWMTLFMVNLLNITQCGMDNKPPVGAFPDAAVRAEFGADAGATSGFPMKSEFGGDFTDMMAFVIHRDDVADAYVVFLAYDPWVLINHIDPAFHALRFK